MPPASDPNQARARLAAAFLRLGEADRGGLQEVYRLTSARLFGICLRICGDRAGTPRSMGLLAAAGPSRLTLSAPQRAGLVSGLKLAVSIEPPAGSPTGLPTGPVVASGELSLT